MSQSEKKREDRFVTKKEFDVVESLVELKKEGKVRSKVNEAGEELYELSPKGVASAIKTILTPSGFMFSLKVNLIMMLKEGGAEPTVPQLVERVLLLVHKKDRLEFEQSGFWKEFELHFMRQPLDKLADVLDQL